MEEWFRLLVESQFEAKDVTQFLGKIRDGIVSCESPNDFLRNAVSLFKDIKFQDIVDKLNFDLFQMLFEVYSESNDCRVKLAVQQILSEIEPLSNARETHLIFTQAIMLHPTAFKMITELLPNVILRIRGKSKRKYISSSFQRIMKFLEAGSSSPNHESNQNNFNDNKPKIMNPSDSVVEEDRKKKQEMKRMLDNHLQTIIEGFLEPLSLALHNRLCDLNIIDNIFINYDESINNNNNSIKRSNDNNSNNNGEELNDLRMEIEEMILHLMEMMYLCYPFSSRYNNWKNRVCSIIGQFNIPLKFWLKRYNPPSFCSLCTSFIENKTHPSTSHINSNDDDDDDNYNDDDDEEEEETTLDIRNRRREEKRRKIEMEEDRKVICVSSYLFYIFEDERRAIRYINGYSIYSFAFIFPQLLIYFSKCMKICRFSISFKSFSLFSSFLSAYLNLNNRDYDYDDENKSSLMIDDNADNNNVQRKRNNNNTTMITEKEYNNNNREYMIHYTYLSTPLSISELQKLIAMTAEFEFLRYYIDFMVKVEDQQKRMRLFDTLKIFLLLFSIPSRLLVLSTLIVYIPYSTLRSQFIYMLKDLILSLRSLSIQSDHDTSHLPLLSYLFSSGRIVEIMFSIQLDTSLITSSNCTEALFGFLNFIRFFLLVERSQSVIGIWKHVEKLLSDVLLPYQLALEKYKFQNTNLMDNSKEQDSQLDSMNALGFGSLSKQQLQHSALSQLNDSLLALDLITRIKEIITENNNNNSYCKNDENNKS